MDRAIEISSRCNVLSIFTICSVLGTLISNIMVLFFEIFYLIIYNINIKYIYHHYIIIYYIIIVE